MNELDILRELKNNFSKTNLSESDTRFKIIDTILTDVLKWPKDPICTEQYINGNRADYVLKGKHGAPLLIIESKRNTEYFQLPINLNHSELLQKIPMEKLLTDNNIKEAVLQVKEYAEDLLCPYACISNGDTWIIFRITSKIKPWKKLPALVIKGIDCFINNYTDVNNLLNYTSVTAIDSLSKNIGVTKKYYPEIFYAKNNITAYNTPVNSNHYAGSLASLSRKFLGVIPESNREFMDYCYVTNKGKHDHLQNNVQGYLHDSLSPYFRNIGFRDFTDNKEGGAFGLRLTKIIRQENLNGVMILFGGRGAGKSTFLKRFLFHVRPVEIDMYSHVALIGLLNASQTPEQLTREIWEKVLIEIDLGKIKKSSRDNLLNVFREEFEVYHNQILSGLSNESSEYQKRVTDFILDVTSDVKLFCEKISLSWKAQNKGLIIFLDNMDQLPPRLQDVCFLTAAELADRLSCLVIVSMREERYYNAKSRGVLDAYQNPGFHLSSPVIPEVITKRLDYILEKLKFTVDVDTEYGIKSIQELNTITAFLSICISELNRKHSPLSYFLRYATHGDVRQALAFFDGFLTSGYLNINEIAATTDWHFQVHQVIKPMMIPDRFFYDERKSKIPNLYQLRNDVNSSHFTGLRIFQVLKNRIVDKGSNGYIDAKFLVQLFEDKFDAKEDCIKHLDLYLEKGLVESSNRLEGYSDEVDQVKITALGDYLFEYLAFNFAYLDLVCLDSGIFGEALCNSLIKSASQELRFYYDRDYMSRIDVRLERTEKFIQYLSEQEEQELKDLQLVGSETMFTKKLMEEFAFQKKRVLKSATNKRDMEYF